MNEAERLLHLFVHDLRSPLSVATGYLRLLQDGKIPEDGDQHRVVMGRSLDALGRIARLCDAVAEAANVAETTGRTSVTALAGDVAHTLAPPSRLASAGEAPAGAVVAAASDTVRAIACLVGPVANRLAPQDVVRWSTRDESLTFAAGDGTRVAGPARPFDPWQGFGLEAVLACRTIAAAGGRVSIGGDADLAVVLPLVRHDES